MAGEFIKDAPSSTDAQAKKMLRSNAGMRGVGTTKAAQVTRSSSAAPKKVTGRRIGSGASTARGGAF